MSNKLSPRLTKIKSISLNDRIAKMGKTKAKQRGFKNSFSAYVSWLIEKDNQALSSEKLVRS